MPLITLLLLCHVFNWCDRVDEAQQVVNTTSKNNATTLQAPRAITNLAIPSHYRLATEEFDRLKDDPPVKYCGPRLAAQVMKVCGDRGTFNPHLPYPKALKRTPREVVLRENTDPCFLFYAVPDTDPVTHCCCRGCTNAYLERYCHWPLEETESNAT